MNDDELGVYALQLEEPMEVKLYNLLKVCLFVYTQVPLRLLPTPIH